MGCGGSKRGCCGENRPEELGKCAAVSPEVRWSWLRGHTLFTFSELRTVRKVFQEATSSELTQLGKLPPTSSTPRGGGGGGPGQATSKSSLWAPMSSPHVKSGSSSPAARMMDKAQFLALCDSDETFRLSVVVGAFGSRLFDVLDKDGDGRLGFEAFALGLSKLLKVRPALVCCCCCLFVFFAFLISSTQQRAWFFVAGGMRGRQFVRSGLLRTPGRYTYVHPVHQRSVHSSK